MKSIAALYDIHGNETALEAVLDALPSHDVGSIVVGGDVFPGPMAPACLDLLGASGVPVHFLRGNGDHDTLEAHLGGPLSRVPKGFRETMRWCSAEAGSERMAHVETWPATIDMEVEGIGRVLFCHATPHDDNTIFTELTPESRMEELLSGVESDVVVCGHTHMQFDRTVAGHRVVNAGSVGMPFDEPGAYWTLLGPGGVSLMRTPYDYEHAAALISATGYPIPMDPSRPSPRASMLAAFEAASAGRAP